MEEKNPKLNVINNSRNKENEKQHKRRIKIGLMRVSLMAMLLIFSTYAWFTSQKDITLSNIRGIVEVVENMEISLDAKTWHQRIDLADAINVFANAQTSRDAALGETDSNAKSTALAVVPSQLLPVSGVGEINNTTMPLYVGEATSTSLSGIAKCDEEITESGKDVAKDNGYFAFDIYIKNTSRDNEADVLQLNINSSAQVLTETIQKTIKDEYGNEVERIYNGNDASGLQNTIRVALAKYEGEVSSTATQFDILDSTKSANISDIAIWEPNAYDHVETIVANNNRLINGTDTNKITFTEYHPDTPLDTYALKEAAVTAGEITNVYNIASTGLGKQNTFKTDNIKNEDDEVESYRIYTVNEKPLDIQNISGANFEISANTVTRYRVYVWLEGQDVDCINVASLGGGIELDLGLTKDNEVGDVLADIDTRVSLNTTEPTTEPVLATITMEEEIAELPEGWEYVNEDTKLAIQKEYTTNTIEQVEIKDVEGKITRIEVAITNIEVVLAEEVIGNEAVIYGQYTNYPVDIDGDATDNDWQIFYAEGESVFLIADDYVKNSVLVNDEMWKSSGSNATYGMYYPYPLPTSVDSGIASKYLFKAPIETSYNNYYKSAHLLNTSVWNTYFKNSNYAESAVGGSTLEMFVQSWNTKFFGDNNYSQLYYAWESTYNYGYYVGTEINPTTSNIVVTGYNKELAKMYFPHPDESSNLDGTNEGYCRGYKIAGLATDHSSATFMVRCSGELNNDHDDEDYYGIRPVVCLNPNIQARKVGEVWQLSAN